MASTPDAAELQANVSADERVDGQSSERSASSNGASSSQAEAVMNLVGLLEEARQADTNTLELQAKKLRQEREAKKKEAARLSAEARKIDQKRRRITKHCAKASTEDLLEVLRIRTLRAEAKKESQVNKKPAAVVEEDED